MCVYTSIIPSVLEYACPVWHPGLTKKPSKDIECVQKRCLKLLFPALSYTESLTKFGLERLDVRLTCVLNKPMMMMITLNVVCMVREFDAYKLSRCICPSQAVR